MKQLINQRKQMILPTAIAIIFCAFGLTFAQGKLGAKYGSRDPRICKKTSSPGKMPTAAEAVASVICNGEHERGNESLFLLEEVKVTQIGKGSPYKPGVDFNVDDLDPHFLIYPIRGSFKKYQCGQPDLFEPGKSCRLYDEANAQGRCYKDTFGEWQCSMDDQTVGFNDYTEVAPPGNTNAAVDKEKPIAAKVDKEKVAAKNDVGESKDENGFPKPDFSKMEKWYQIIRYEYAPFEKKLHIFVKTSFEYRQRPTQFKMEFRDKNGMLLQDTTLSWIIGLTDATVGEPAEGHVNIPRESILKQVAIAKAVRIVE